MSPPDTTEARYLQGDLVRAMQTFVTHKLPATTAGAAECERMLVENREGTAALLRDAEYRGATIRLAQAVMEQLQEGA